MLQVLKEPDKSAEATSYLWLYRTEPGEHPRNYFVAEFTGYLHVDGYAGYHEVAKVKLAGCWASARRKFDEALQAATPGKGWTIASSCTRSNGNW